MDNIILLVFALCALFIFYKLFTGIYIGFLIVQGLYTSKELDEFPINLVTGEKYNSLLQQIDLFISQTLKDIKCTLSLNGNDINCLVYRGSIPIKPQALISDMGLLFYSFIDEKLFEEDMCFAVTEVGYTKREISVLFATPDNADLPFFPAGIVIRKKSSYPEPPSNKLEKWIRERGENALIIASYIYKSNFILSLFNSDLNFTEAEIVAALKKVTSLEIVNSQLVFTVDPNGRGSGLNTG